MSDFVPFKHNVGDEVFAYDLFEDDLALVKTIVVHRFITTKGNFYTTTIHSNIAEKYLMSRDEALVSTLAGKILEI